MLSKNGEPENGQKERMGKIDHHFPRRSLAFNGLQLPSSDKTQ